MGKFDKFWVRSLLLTALSVVNLLCKTTKIDQVAQVNNNLNSLLKHPKRFIKLLPNLTQLFSSSLPKAFDSFFSCEW